MSTFSLRPVSKAHIQLPSHCPPSLAPGSLPTKVSVHLRHHKSRDPASRKGSKRQAEGRGGRSRRGEAGRREGCCKDDRRCSAASPNASVRPGRRGPSEARRCSPGDDGYRGGQGLVVALADRYCNHWCSWMARRRIRGGEEGASFDEGQRAGAGLVQPLPRAKYTSRFFLPERRLGLGLTESAKYY